MRIVNLLAAAAAAIALPAIALPAAASAQESVLADAHARVAKYSQLPPFIAPGPAFDAKACMAGKTIAVVPLNSAVPFGQDILNGIRDTADKVGFKLINWENQGEPTQWAAGVTNAINEKANLVDLMAGVNPATVEPQIEQATAAGITVNASHFYDYSQKPLAALSSHVPNNFAEIGRILASWAIDKTGGKANVLVIGSDEVTPTAPFVDAIRTMMESCKECSFTYQNVPVNDWSTRLQSVVQSTLLAKPEINYILPIYDGAVQFIVPAIAITGRQDDVKIASFNGSPFVLDMIQNGDVEMDVGESPDWLGHVIADHDMRLLCNAPREGNPNIPLMIFSAANAETAGKPASSIKGYGTDYVAKFEALWGLK